MTDIVTQKKNLTIPARFSFVSYDARGQSMTDIIASMSVRVMTLSVKVLGREANPIIAPCRASAYCMLRMPLLAAKRSICWKSFPFTMNAITAGMSPMPSGMTISPPGKLFLYFHRERSALRIVCPSGVPIVLLLEEY